MPRVNPRKDVFNTLIANPSCIALALDSGVEFEADEQKEWHDKWHRKTIYYAINYNNECPLIPKKIMKRAVNIAMTTWNLEIPIKIKSLYRNKQKADIIISFKKSKDDQYFKERKGVLAYAYFPGTSKSGEIVFNTDYIWATHSNGILGSEAVRLGLIDQAFPTNKLVTWNILQTLIHEIGHSLGLRHDSDNNSRDVMDPYYDGKVLDLSDRDLLRIRLKYGVRNWSSWTKYNIIKKWLLRRVRRI
jgi:predicted Zn-dependent protease